MGSGALGKVRKQTHRSTSSSSTLTTSTSVSKGFNCNFCALPPSNSLETLFTVDVEGFDVSNDFDEFIEFGT